MNEYAACVVALREWAVICQGLAAGSLCIIARKGGIHERGGGLFSLRYQQCCLLPSYEHQDLARLAPGLRGSPVSQPAAEDVLVISHWASVAGACTLSDESQLATLAAMPEQGLSSEELSARFRYRDQPWLHVLVLQVWAFPQPHLLTNSARYGGCRSWIPLHSPLPSRGSTPVLDQQQLDRVLDRVRSLAGFPLC